MGPMNVKSVVLLCGCCLWGLAFGGQNDWTGRRVAFLGDSITDARHIGCTSNYWNYLQRDLGIVPLVYGINGHQWIHVYAQAQTLLAEHPNDVDDIVIFAGTNDYNANTPLGTWTDGEASFRGRIARVMDFCATNYPTCPVWLITPLHRGYATFGATNVQPDESYANTLGIWLDAYVDVLKEAAAKWNNATLVDLHAESGLYPLASAYAKFFHNASTDLLHPNDAGHARMAAAIAARFTSRDATARVRELLAATPDGGTLRFAKDVYHFYWDDAETMWLDPSNNKSGEKKVLFPLVGRRNLTIDGGGSTFVLHGKVFPFAVTNCAGVTIRNFTMRTHYPAVAEFKVLEKTSGGFLVQFAESACPYRTENGCIIFKTEGEETGTTDRRLSLHALNRLKIHFLFAGDTTASFTQIPAPFVRVDAEDRGNRQVFFRYRACDVNGAVTCPYEVGEPLVVNLAENRDRLGFFFQDCRDVTVEHVTMTRGAGMGVVAQRTENVTLRDFDVAPATGDSVTLTADAIQLINCCGQVLIEGCDIAYTLDDVLNIHGNYLMVEGVNGRDVSLRAKHKSHEGFFPYRPGDSVEFVVARTRAVVATAKVVGVATNGVDHYACTLTVDADLSSRVAAGTLVENATLNPNVTIRNNRFHDYPNVRLSGRGRYLVENNRFENEGTAVVGMDLAEYWFESGRISEMTIRNNTIVNGGGFSFGLSGWNGSEADLPKIHGTITLEGNTFQNVSGAKWSVVGVRTFTGQ